MAKGTKRPRFCTNCGAKLGETVKFCPDCGTAVTAEATSESKKEKEPSLISRVGGPVAAFRVLMSDKKLRRVAIGALALVIVIVIAIILIASGGRDHSAPSADRDDGYTVQNDDTQQDNGESDSLSVSDSTENGEAEQAEGQDEVQNTVWEEQADDPSVLPYLMDVDSSGNYYIMDNNSKLKIRFQSAECEDYVVAEEYVALLESRGYTAELTEAYELPEGWYGDVKLWTLHHPQVEGNAYVRYECDRGYDMCYIDLGWDGEISLAKKFLRPTGDPAVLPSFDRYDPTTRFFEANESTVGKAIYEISDHEFYTVVADYVEALEQYGWKEVDSDHVIYNDTLIGVVSSWELRNKDVEGNLRVSVKAWNDSGRCYVTFIMPEGLQMEDFSLNHGTVDTSSSNSGGSSDDDDFYDRDETFVPEFAKLDCLTCRGDGDCNTCGGDGYTGFGDAKAGCRTCHGDGDCRACGGSGKRD